MHASLRRLLLAASTGAALLLAGCASEKPALNTTFDFGPATNAAQAARAPIAAVVVGDVTGSAALDSERMYYRLNYSDPLQARAYANSRWSATPLQMVTQRLKSRIAQSGAKVLSVSDASDGVPILRLEIDDFTHNFDSQAQSHGQLVLRASLFQGHKLIDQKTFDRKNPATSMDAGGGARALAGATDTVAADVIAWLATLPLKKE
ncbi:ABC-type transport auxiliary lipoprotein family protein [Massilia sp. CCM 9206]|nr:ABC-type transport auxiliary lipoprotein family protein [Massilia sp. CCM 9206]